MRPPQQYVPDVDHPSLLKPTIWPDANGPVVALRHPWVVVVDHAVLLAPPIQRRHHKAQAKHPPDDRDLHAVELLQVGHVTWASLRAALLQPVPQHKLHDLAIFGAMEACSTQLPILRHGFA